MSDNPPIEFAFPELRKWEKGAAPYIHVLESGKPGPTVMVAALTHGNEVSRAVVVRPCVERADLLLDLHSMHDDGVPLMLAGPLAKGVALARKVGTPVDIIADAGHAAGMRMRDYGGFGDPKSAKNALLIETGQHWRNSSAVVAKDVTWRFLVESGIVE